MSRTYLGRNFGVGTRERVYESDDAIEIDSTDQYELSRKRVLFEDIALITYHREFGWGYLSAHIFVAVVFLGIAEVTYAAGGGWIAASIITLFAVPSIIALVLRLSYRVDVISVFGRRSRATMRFAFKKEKARELYGRLCYRTRQVQRNIEESNRLIQEAQKQPIEPAIDPSLLPPPIEEQESIG